MNNKSAKSALLWTGGKDCCHVLHLVPAEIDYLVTLVPKNFNDHSFKAHPIYEIKNQAQKLGIKLLFIEVITPYVQGYEAAFLALKTKYAITTIYTGDIEFYDTCSNIIENSCIKNNIKIIRPLWKKERMALMLSLLQYKIEAKITWVTSPYLQTNFLGKIITKELIKELQMLPIDLCGEKGEYYTMVINCPLMNK